MNMEAIPVGENALIIKVDGERTADCVQQIRQLHQQIDQLKIPALRSIRPALDCLMLEFESEYDSKLILDSLSLSVGAMNPDPTSELLEIPVCYDAPFARDLDSLAEVLGLKPHEIVDLHAEETYDVWMLGFMPGYPYMGSLNEQIQLPRKSSPDLSVPAGSVAIAEEFVGVYPFDSPGGWHIIGRTPLPVVDYSRGNPFLFQYGMKIKFFPITNEEFEQYK